MLKRTISLALAIVLMATAGCSFLQESERTTRVTVIYATLKVIDDDDEKAARVAEIATEVKRYAENIEVLTVEALIDETRRQIRWENLDAADTLLVDTLLLELKDRLTERFDGTDVPDDIVLTVVKVANWVIDATRLA